MSVLKFIFTTAYYALFLLIVVVTGLLLVSLFPIENNYQVKVVLSGSMEPAINVGSVVVIKSAPIYGVGDVITFGRDTKSSIPITHRIVEKDQVGRRITYTTKGDANEDIDTATTAHANVIGKILFSVPYLGFVLDFVKQPIGFITFVLVPAALIVIGEIWKIACGLRSAAKIRREKKSAPIFLPKDDAPVVSKPLPKKHI